MTKPEKLNELNRDSRFICLVVATGLIAYGIHGLWIDDLYLPGKHGGYHLHGGTAWLLFSAVFCLSMFFYSFVLDHYSRTFHQRYSRLSRKVLGWAAALLFFSTIAIIIWQMFSQMSCCENAQSSLISTLASE